MCYFGYCAWLVGVERGEVLSPGLDDAGDEVPGGEKLFGLGEEGLVLVEGVEEDFFVGVGELIVCEGISV